MKIFNLIGLYDSKLLLSTLNISRPTRKLYFSKDVFDGKIPKIENNNKFCDEKDADIFNNLHNTGENYKNKYYISTENTLDLMKKHLKETNGQVRTRFPPEPNGLIHIGHAKAINLSFGYAKAKQGLCFTRFDDTNPETEEEIFTKNIIEMIKWLGFEPFKITYASDYFSQLHNYAIKLIKNDFAFVCHEPKSESLSFPNKQKEIEYSPWRSRPVAESLQAFEDMLNKKYKEEEATLRLKFNTDFGKVDPIIYRIKYKNHSRTKDTWCIYPTYDFAHGLCDSIENITHSMCTFEFAPRRSLYYKICNTLNVYCPVQTEFGRLNFHYTVVSKRKILKLVEAGYVKDWDDPRLFTLAGLRRRGIPPESINELCNPLGFNPSNIYIDPEHLYQCVRKQLQTTSFRMMAVLKPLKLIITNFPENEEISTREAPNLPGDESKGKRKFPFDKVVWIEQTDFQMIAEKSFRRLTESQSVGLKYSDHVITVDRIVRNCEGTIDHLEVRCFHRDRAPLKPKAYIHWVANPKSAEIRIYNKLFLHERPDDLETVPGGFLSDVNPDSLEIISGLIENNGCKMNHYDRFQFERVGYFSVDPSSTEDHLVFNRTVDLKQLKGFHK